jgi:hypothetical protein
MKSTAAKCELRACLDDDFHAGSEVDFLARLQRVFAADFLLLIAPTVRD